jgi:hypothetical protein
MDLSRNRCPSPSCLGMEWTFREWLTMYGQVLAHLVLGVPYSFLKWVWDTMALHEVVRFVLRRSAL